MILLIVFLSGVAAIICSLLLTNIYRSEATIDLRDEQNGPSPLGSIGGLGGMVASQLGIGGGGSLEKIEAVLKSRDLSVRVIDKYNMMPMLFSDIWDANQKIWLSEKPPTMQDGLAKIKSLLSVKAYIKKSLITVGVELENPETAKKMVDYYLTELSTTLREEVIRDAVENMRFFREQQEKQMILC